MTVADRVPPRRPSTGGALTATGLVKSYAGVTVLHSVDLQIPAGEVVGLIGANGSEIAALAAISLSSRPACCSRPRFSLAL